MPYASMIAGDAVNVFGFDSLRRLYFGVLLVLFSPYFIRILYQ